MAQPGAGRPAQRARDFAILARYRGPGDRQMLVEQQIAERRERARDAIARILERPGGEPYGLLLTDCEIRPRPSAEHPLDDIAGDLPVAPGIEPCRPRVGVPGEVRVGGFSANRAPPATCRARGISPARRPALLGAGLPGSGRAAPRRRDRRRVSLAGRRLPHVSCARRLSRKRRSASDGASSRARA